jgi:quinol monooxygenase YgiN
MLNPNEFRVAVHLKAKTETAAELRQLLLGMLAPTRAEDGCILYDLHQVEGSPDEFFVFERWASAEAHHKHLETPHFKELIAVQPNLVAQLVTAYHLKQIG